MFPRFLCTAALMAVCLTASARDYTVGAIHVTDPWARATPPGAPVAGGFLTLSNAGGPDRLVAASADVSEAVELHTMRMDGDVMRMQRLEHGIELPAGGTVVLRPGSLHVMFIGLKSPLKPDTHFPLTLQFERAGSIRVDMVVRSMGADMPHMGHPHDH